MGKLCRGILFLSLILLLAIPPACARERSIPTVDHIPLGDWTYDAMISLAADGLLPGYSARVFAGDRLFDRMQMADVVALAIDAGQQRPLTSQQTALVDRLVMEFKPELEYLYPSIVDDWIYRTDETPVPNGETFPLGYVRATPAYGPDAEALVTIPFRLSVFSALSDRSFGLGTIAAREDKFFDAQRSSTQPDKVLFKGFDSNFVWSLGREYQSWGPSYAGGLVLSDNSAPFWGARAAKDIDFGKLLGRFKITESMNVFQDKGQTLYLFGRRWEKPVSKRLFLGISEAAKMSRCPNPGILVLPVYLYQHIFGGPGSELDVSMNALYGTDLTYRSESGTEVYGEFIIDDITAPDIFGPHFERPRKIGYTLGCYLPKLLGGERFSSFRAEYTFTDPPTYEATRIEFPELAYVHDHAIIGTPIGPNSKALYLRGEYYLTEKWSVIGEYLNQQQNQAGKPESPKSDNFSVTAACDIAADKSIALRISPFKTRLPGQAEETGVNYELRAIFAF